MSSIAAVFDQQAAGYERNVLEQWDSLEQWERDYYQQFASWAGDKGAVKRNVLVPEQLGYRRTRYARQDVPRTVTLAYALIAVGLFFSPLAFEGAALALATINVARGRWGHGLVQFAAAAVAIALYQAGMIVPGETYDAIVDAANRFQAR